MATPSLATKLATTLALIEQYSQSLSTPPAEATSYTTDDPSPLPLFSASANALKDQTTKLSLLAINIPFTPSAISSILSAVNESVLPSLVTGTLLTTPESFTNSFSNEVSTMTKTVLKDFRTLVDIIVQRTKATANIREEEKKSVTEATGRIWDDCDNLMALATGGIAGLIVKKAQEYQALIQDAIKELEDWDPEDEDDDLFGDTGSDDEGEEDEDEDETDSSDSEILTTQKESMLKVFGRVPQCIHVIVKNRLQKNFPAKPTSRELTNLDRLLYNLETTSEAIDEAAGALYERDLFSAKTYTDKVKARTADAVDCVLQPWSDAKDEVVTETKEDRYIQRAREWIQSAGVETNASSSNQLTKPKSTA